MQHQSIQQRYEKVAVPKLMEMFGYANTLAVPRMTKIVLNVGTGKHVKDKAFTEHAEKILTAITGQKPLTTFAKKAIANFKIRAGQPVGLKVTLRGKRMDDFLEKLINVTLPRIRDFHGLSTKGFDKKGNYTMGFKEHTAFPEITSDDIERLHGLEVTLVMNTQHKQEGGVLLRALNFPLKAT